jgi:hypothetical protein
MRFSTEQARLYLLGGPLYLPHQGAGGGPSCPSLPCLTAGQKLAGVRFTKAANSGPLRVRELIIDGHLDPNTEGCDYNIVVLDVTDPNDPQPIGRLKAHTFPHNNRTFIPIPPDPNDGSAFVLPQANNTRTYDVRVRLTAYRANALNNLSALAAGLGVTVSGGLTRVDSGGKNICEEVMPLQSLLIDPGYTSPVKVRLSAKAN